MVEKASSRSGPDEQLRIGPFQCRPRANMVTDPEGKEHTLKPKTMDLLVFLFENRNRVITKDEIFDAVWADSFVGDGVLWKSIFELRQILEEDPKNPRIIVTIPRRGYRLNLPEDVPADRTDGENHPADRTGTGWVSWSWRVPALVGTVVFAALLAWWLFAPDTEVEVLPVPERPMILVAEIENLTGEELLDGTLEYAFENSLLRSSLLRTASRTRIEQGLQRMGRRVDTPIDDVVAREIGVRDGGVAAILSGNVTKLGSEYELGVRLLDPPTGEILFASTARASNADSLLPAVQELSREILRRVFELKSLPPPPSTDRRVWTPSLRAFHAYLQALEIYRFGRYGEAETFSEKAIEIDPEFASAHLMLG